MSSDDGKSDDYWLGVRDALRMVDSFLKWSKRNESQAKSLEEFLHDGLIAAAKRCEECLSKELGIKFSPEDSITDDIGPEIELTPDGFDKPVEVPISLEDESEPIETREEVPSDSDEIEPMTIDAMGSSEGSISDDLTVEGEMRDFTSDFDLVEPSPLIIDKSSDETEELPSSEPEPSFTWKDYEQEVTPEEAPSETQPESHDDDKTKSWSPMDEPSDISEKPLEDETSEGHRTIETPPPPPPPPEPEESEEERKRRARRLFFGA